MPMMKLCPNNHYYDSERHNSCPYCQEVPVSGSKRPRENGGESWQPGVTEPVSSSGSNEKVKVKPSEKTKSIWEEKTNPDSGKNYPRVVGWLVCTSGADIGRDFRLHAENNFVGRNSDNDVKINDPHVSGKHFIVTYDPLNGDYFISMNGGSSIVRVNNGRMTPNQILNKGDKIEVGKTTLIFIPLESSIVKWNWEQVK